VPSLDLRFAENKSLVDATTGQNLVTFTRASSGTYVGSDGLIKTATTNEARFDHNPTTGESLGLLVEEQRTNLITNSESLANATGATISNNTTTAPNGFVTAQTLTEDTSTGAHSVNTASITWAGNTNYTFSIFLKANTRTQVNLAFGSSSFWVNGQRNALFDLSTGTIVSVAGSPVVASIEAFPNGWYRCRVTATTIAAPASSTVQIQLYVGSTSYPGDGASGIYFWGAQLETSAFPTSYIPTTGATMTRNADVASITGTNFSSWYRQDEGTSYGEFTRFASTNTQQGRVFSFSDGSTTNAIEIYQTGPTNPAAQISASGLQAQWLGAGFTTGLLVKEVLGYQLNNSLSSFNGSSETIDAACTMPTALTQARIGDRHDGVRSLNGTIRRLTYWPRRLGNEVLQEVTR
jgi:hypothetical protein